MPTVTAPGWRTQTVVVGLAGLLLVSGCTAMAENAQVFGRRRQARGTPSALGHGHQLDRARPHRGGPTAALRLRQAGLIADGMLYYESTDCSGTV
jgi:hypothetical protein